VPTQSAASSVAATPPPAFLRCRLSGTLDDGAPLGIIQQRDFGGFRGRFHRRPVTRRWRSLSFSDGGSGDDCFAIPGELAGREWFATRGIVLVSRGLTTSSATTKGACRTEALLLLRPKSPCSVGDVEADVSVVRCRACAAPAAVERKLAAVAFYREYRVAVSIPLPGRDAIYAPGSRATDVRGRP
jgi:hypothetical protein